MIESRDRSYQTSVIGGALLHKFDSVPGSSGSPILNSENEVVATHIGYTRILGRSANLASTGRAPLPFTYMDYFGKECWDYNPFCSGGSSKKVRICKQSITVNLAVYALCKASVAAIPASCTAAAAMTAGTSCWANMGVAAATCGVSMKSIIKLGNACIDEMSK